MNASDETPDIPIELTQDERRKRLIATCQVITHEITMLQMDRTVFERFRDGAQGTVVMRTHFPGAVARWYAYSILVRLRRLIDADSKAHSLLKILNGLIAHPQDWSLGAIETMFAEIQPPTRNKDMIGYLAANTYSSFADKSGQGLDVRKIQQDREALKAALETAKVVVDKTMAHLERDADVKITFGDMHAAIDDCERIVRPYIALLTGAGYGKMTPYEQDAWYRIFEPWKTLKPKTFRPKAVSSA